MGKVTSHPKSAGPGIRKGICKPSDVSREAEGISCIWCYLVKEGMKKAYSGIKGLRAKQAGKEK